MPSNLQTSEIVTDPEFASLLAPQSHSEMSELERSLNLVGCRDALVVWFTDGKKMMLDGHKRWATNSPIARLAIKTERGAAPITSLSGGNQQKCILARWLLTEPKVLLLDEPTRGIDVVAKAEVHATIDRLARDGLAVLLISSELPEILGMSDRVLVMRDGGLAGEVDRAAATEEILVGLAAGLREPAKVGA